MKRGEIYAYPYILQVSKAIISLLVTSYKIKIRSRADLFPARKMFFFCLQFIVSDLESDRFGIIGAQGKSLFFRLDRFFHAEKCQKPDR